MRPIKILKVLINILYVLLIAVFVLGVAFFIAVLFFNEHLPQFLQGYKMLFTRFNWKLFLIPFITIINFILFVIAVYFLRKCIKPFEMSEFYSVVVIKNLKRAGNLFLFIGVSSIVFRLIAVFYLQSQVLGTEGYFGLRAVLAIISTIDVTVLFLIIIGLFLLLFSKAFANAKELKEENDLTI